jgi:fructoselysine-6-P-deglycase FrlB-like protein
MTEAYPELRSGAPWVMSDMVTAQQELPAPILAETAAVAAVASSVSEALAQGRAVVVTGCGTSEHAARAIVALLAEPLADTPGASGIVARQAFDATLVPQSGGVCIAVTHNGSSGATVAALEAARAAGARTCVITATTVSPARAAADVVVPTPFEDASWCHTVGYLSPVLAGAAVAAALGGPTLSAARLRDHLAACDVALAALEPAAELLAERTRLLSVGSGLDAITASEQALKIEEGAWIPTSSLELETLLHGHLPAHDTASGMIVFLLDPRRRSARAQRTRQALEAAGAVGIASLLVTTARGAAALDNDTLAGVTLLLPEAEELGSLGALLAGAVALQRLTLALAARRGTNPDLLRRDDVRYRTAALLGAHKLTMFAPPD